MTPFLIYAANSPSGKRYVGQTRNSLRQRRNEHMRDVRAGSALPVHCAIRKYGDAMMWAVIGIAFSQDAANEVEMSLIAEQGEYNIREGGDVSPLADETKEKLRIAATGKARPAVAAANRARRGVKYPNRKRTAGWKCRPYTMTPMKQETRDKISAKNKGRSNPGVAAANRRRAK